jgi:hypothetical protein
MKFSQRLGIVPSFKEIQLNDIDQELKNGLWNVYDGVLLASLNPPEHFLSNYSSDFNEDEKQFAQVLWHNFFKWLIDSVPNDRYNFKGIIKQWFFKAKWYEIYDLIQFSVASLKKGNIGVYDSEIEVQFNLVFEREFAGYRFIEGLISPITNENEITELKHALSNSNSFSPLKGCNIHLVEALKMLSDKENPDYRNSIKESISAVESLVKVIAQKPGAELSSAIDRIKGQIKIHPSLEQGFKKLYGYTSDEGGIRHAMMDEPNCYFEDAKFMLISCSAFINYLIVKANKAGISFE